MSLAMRCYRLKQPALTLLNPRGSKDQVPLSLARACFSSTGTNSDNKAQYCDVMIVGGGVVGCALARQLNRRLPCLSVHLIEAREAPTTTQPKPTTIPNPRSYALSPSSLETCGLLDSKILDQVKLGWYDSMQIWEARNPATMRFHADDLPFRESKLHHPKMLGAMVEDAPLVRALWESLESHPQTRLSTNTTVKDLQLSSNNRQGLVTVETSDQTIHQTRLLVAADGSQSPIRERLGVKQMQWDYGRQALTFTVELAHNDRLPRTAFQRFIHGKEAGMGPLALLPTHSPRHAIVVWSTTPEIVQKYKETDDNNDELIEHLQELLQTGPQRLPPLVEPTKPGQVPPLLSEFLSGIERVLETVQDAGAMAAASNARSWMAPPRLSKIVSPKLSFPLACRNVGQYHHAQNRVVLVGDAAHTVHPMAGQGLNLGLAAVETLVESLEQSEAVGMDVTHGLDTFLRKRHAANTSVILGIHALHEIFAVQENVPLMHAKSFGMNVLQQVGPLRRRIVQAATQGIVF